MRLRNQIAKTRNRKPTWLLFFFPRKKYMYYDEGGFLKMEINKQNLVNSLLKVGSILIYTGSVGAVLYDVIKSKTDKDIEKLNKRIDSLEKSKK